MDDGNATSNPSKTVGRTIRGQCVLTLRVLSVAISAATACVPAAAVGQLGSVDILTRNDGQVLPVYAAGGRNWVIGTPGQEYSIRYCNKTPGRVLAVMSVDGVNVVSGDTAAPSQSGYVLSAYECADIQGWRKNLARTAAFYFTELPDSYAARTGRPENVGVIGVAVFREKQPVLGWRRPYKDKVAADDARGDAPAKAAAPEPRRYEQDAQANAESPRAREEAAGRLQGAPVQSLPVPAPMAKLGTGHGRFEDSPTQMVRFERESATPNETIAIYYDRRENLAAMGILPPPVVARSANPFPGWQHFVPDPPNR